VSSIPADITVEGRRIGGAYFTDGRLSETVRRASTSTKPVVSPRECEHPTTGDGFAYVDLWNIHWPIRVCLDCRTILLGRSPDVERTRRPAWELDEDDVIAAKWASQWPREGRPRAKKPPSPTRWPEEDDRFRRNPAA
jgi:hypothetical protein